jgi:hypothetical protein
MFVLMIIIIKLNYEITGMSQQQDWTLKFEGPSGTLYRKKNKKEQLF